MIKDEILERESWVVVQEWMQKGDDWGYARGLARAKLFRHINSSQVLEDTFNALFSARDENYARRILESLLTAKIKT